MKTTPFSALGLVLALAACNQGPVNSSVNTIKAPVVATTQLAYDLSYSGTRGLSEVQTNALREYLDLVHIRYGDHISIDDPNAAGASARRAAVADVVAKYGLFLDPVGPVSTGALPPGTMRVLITRTIASAPPECPDWRRESNPEYEASSMSNHGCAMVSNLAVMAADPNDLVVGKTYEGADGHTASKALGVFRERKPTGAGELKVGDIKPGK